MWSPGTRSNLRLSRRSDSTSDSLVRPTVLQLSLGVTKEDATNLKVYQHFRPVETAEKHELLERNEGILQTGILDPLALDTPRDSWVTQVGSGCVATLRSLLWPGYAFFHVVHTADFWGVYVGDGQINRDLPFML